MAVPIWGWADPGEQVVVTFNENKVEAAADADGNWLVKLPALEAGGPFEMTITGKNTIQLTDILVGEVWIGSGQSNMEMGIGAVKDGPQEVAAANYPNIRLFMVPNVPAGQPQADCNGSWQVCTPESIAAGGWSGFSAAAYFFGREIHQQLNVPVGLMDASWGGTAVEPWTPPVGFEQVPSLQNFVNTINQATENYKNAVAQTLTDTENWIHAARQALEAGKRIPPQPVWPEHPLKNPGHPVQPTCLYNGMVSPVKPFAIRGALWYQGEANLGDRMLYYDKMKALIQGWRTVWQQGEFPFYLTLLAPYRYTRHDPNIDPTLLAKIWEAQRATLAIPNTGLAVTTDISNLDDIHPANKQDVGKRLALWALAKVYGKDVVYSGPLYSSLSMEVNKIRIGFDHVGSGLASRDGQPLNWFEIAGEDKKFVKAEAVIDGNTVVVSAESIASPVAVRFGWLQEAEPNLVNKEGLPACPFRTDQWD
jgi:sialate O-acetylesterase